MKHVDFAARGRVYAVLLEYGLKPFRSRRGVKVFRGPLRCQRGPVSVEFEIDDWDFTRYPRVSLLDRPERFPALLAHVDGLGGICYFAPESVLLDRFRPDEAVQQCLDAVIKVLDDVMSGVPQSDAISNEFSAYWTVGQLPEAWPVLVDTWPKDSATAYYYFLKEHGKPSRGLIASDILVARKLVENIDIEEIGKGSFSCLSFRSSVMPGVGLAKLPSTIAQFFGWLRMWDPKLAKQVQDRLGSDTEYLKRTGTVIAVSTPAGGLGIRFVHDHKHRLGYAKAPKLYRQYLHTAGGTTSITRLKLDDISAEYIHTRNLNNYSSLANRRITLVGCGAIGGYLASALVRLGAGTGTTGLLRLYDVGGLEPDNLGRHILGFPALYQNKAKALQDELIRQFPYLKLESHEHDPAFTDEFFATDLVIDCTGNEAVSEKLNARHLKSRRCPLLYVWIRGNGECVQALWVDENEKHACYRCMRLGPGPNYRQERFPVLDHDPATRFLGCRSFTPYAVSSPLSAAALAADMIIDWIKGNVTPRFRTRYIENCDARIVKNQDLIKGSECPACHPL